MTKPYYNADGITIYHGDCLDVLPQLEDSSIDLICTDPPYFKVKGEWWDRQWDTRDGFLKWFGMLCDQWQQVLKPNGSLYCFASPQMAWHVEGVIRERFNVLNRIHWEKEKDRGKHAQTCKDEARAHFPNTEAIIFAEHFSADNMAKGEAGYVAKCDELRGFVFEPLRSYLCGEFERASMLNTAGKIAANVACGFSESSGGMASRHYFSRSQWCLPTPEHYEAMRQLLNTNGSEYLRTEYEELRTEYEELRTEYEELRRPFNITADDQYTDVWTFPTVATYQGKHVCEKPAELLNQIMRTSGKPGCVMLDCFAGSGSSLIAAKDAGYQAIGMEACEDWARRCAHNVARGFTYNRATIKQPPSTIGQKPLF